MQMREATPKALAPGNRKGAKRNAARSSSTIAFNSNLPGGSSETIQLNHDAPRSLPRGPGLSGKVAGVDATAAWSDGCSGIL